MGRSQKEYWDSLSSRQRAVLIAEFLSINPKRAGTRKWYKFLSQQCAADSSYIGTIEASGSYRDIVAFSEDLERERFNLSRFLRRTNRNTDQ